MFLEGGLRGVAHAAVFVTPFALLASSSTPAQADAAQAAPPPRKQAEPPLPPSVRAWDSDWDRRKLKVRPAARRALRAALRCLPGAYRAHAAPRQEGTGSRTLYLVRHGQYANSETSKDDAQHTLTALGREQALQTGRRLAALLGDTRVRRITHSTMARAAETAALVSQALPGVPLQPCALLREGAPARPEPDTWRPKERDVWVDGARIEAAFREHIHRSEGGEGPDVEVIVCHGNVIRYCVLRALQLPPEAWLRLGLVNGSITKVVCRPDGHVSVHCVGDAGHFEPKLITFN